MIITDTFNCSVSNGNNLKKRKKRKGKQSIAICHINPYDPESID
jgi:hypothetical protein